MAKKQPVLVHPLKCAKAIEEYHERVGYLLMAAQFAHDILKDPANLPKEYIDKMNKDLGDRIEAVRAVFEGD